MVKIVYNLSVDTYISDQITQTVIKVLTYILKQCLEQMAHFTYQLENSAMFSSEKVI